MVERVGERRGHEFGGQVPGGRGVVVVRFIGRIEERHERRHVDERLELRSGILVRSLKQPNGPFQSRPNNILFLTRPEIDWCREMEYCLYSSYSIIKSIFGCDIWDDENFYARDVGLEVWGVEDERRLKGTADGTMDEVPECEEMVGEIGGDVAV